MNLETRRTFIKSAAVAAGFIGLRTHSLAAAKSPGHPASGANSKADGYGPLLKDPQGLMRLPKNFSYKIISKTGERMDDGFYVPGGQDGMGAFAAPDGKTLLIRNHELSPGAEKDGPHAGKKDLWQKLQSNLYDPARGKDMCLGGTTTLVYDTHEQKLIQHSMSLAGTMRNCAGGVTPWGSWITCEETTNRADEDFELDHGYNFEVSANSKMGFASPVALKEMGRFNHEAVAVDPASGIVYQTEDRHDGLIYRYIPNVRGRLEKGGRLQALAIQGGKSKDTRNWPEDNLPAFPIGERVRAQWIDLTDIESPEDDLRYQGFDAGAARFARGEGMIYGNGEIYFACTNGGSKKLGQIFRYKPSEYEGMSSEAKQPGELELFIESHDSELLKSCDNLTIAPWGDVVICEDDGESSAVVGVTREGKLYHIAHVDYESELAGPCFSPDGTTLFVNIQWNPGLTLAITGPWRERIG